MVFLGRFGGLEGVKKSSQLFSYRSYNRVVVTGHAVRFK